MDLMDDSAVLSQGEKSKAEKTAENKRKKKHRYGGGGEDEEPDLDTMDWWSKYHASVDTMIQVTTLAMQSNTVQLKVLSLQVRGVSS